MKFRIYSLFLSLFTCLIFAPTVGANVQLDQDFGSSGIVLTNVQAADSGSQRVYNIIQLASGKLLAVGRSFGEQESDENGHNFALVRYNADGSLDTTFGDNGLVTTSVGDYDLIRKVYELDDGKLLVGGYTQSGDRDFAVARYLSNGELDTSFGDNGIVITDFGYNEEDYVAGMVMQSDGKPVLVAESYDGTSYFVALARYNTDGSLDTSFDGDGLLRLGAIGGEGDHPEAIIQQSDGKLLITGSATNALNDDLFVVRLNQDGSMDTSFEGDGIFAIEIEDGDDRGRELLEQADGKIIVAGYHHDNSKRNGHLIRLNADGSLDTTFDSDGIASFNLADFNDRFYSVVQQADGKLIAVGSGQSSDDIDQFLLVRFNEDGSLDTSFDSDGIVTTQFPDVEESKSRTIIQQADGKFVAAGYTVHNDQGDFALARFNSDGSLDTSFGNDGLVTHYDEAGTADLLKALIKQSDGKLVVAGSSDDGHDNELIAVVRYNQDGTLDTSFDEDGIVTTAVSGSGEDYGNALLQQSDDKLIVAGRNHSQDFTLVRYNTDGSLDDSFDSDGIVTTSVGTSAAINGLIQLSDGSIMTVGDSTQSGTQAITLALYQSNGSLDTNFDTDGIVTTVVDTENSIGSTIIQQLDSKLVVAGARNNSGANDFVVARYDLDGSLDTSFDSDGIATLELGGDDTAYDVIQQDDGKLVVVGVSIQSGVHYVAVARFNSNGSLDTNFDDDGYRLLSAGNSKYAAYSISQLANDKLIIAGQSLNANSRYELNLIRLNSDGSSDSDFEENGFFSFDLDDVQLTTDNDVLGINGFVIDGNDAYLAGTASSDFYTIKLTNLNDRDGDGVSDEEDYFPDDASKTLKATYLIETGSVDITNTIDNVSATTINLKNSFVDPVVIPFVTTMANISPLEARVTNVSTNSFDIFLEAPDGSSQTETETVSYLVVEKGRWTLASGLVVEAGTTETDNVHRELDVGDDGDAISFSSAFDFPPVVLHSLNSYNNGNFMTSRIDNVSTNGFNTEQEAAGSGSNVTTETIGWVAFSADNGTIGAYSYEISFQNDGTADGVDDGPHSISMNSFGDTPAAIYPDVIVDGQSFNDGDGYWARGNNVHESFNRNHPFSLGVFAQEDQVFDSEQSHGDETFGWAAFESGTQIWLRDLDGDLVDDAQDDDDDGDGVNDDSDAFPLDNTETTDTDGDGIGNNTDTDDDGDGYSDSDESDNGTDSLGSNSTPTDTDGDFVSDINDEDDDNDGFSDYDETDNGTSTTNALSFPSDIDGDFISNLYDNDDGNDGVVDGLDADWNSSGYIEAQLVDSLGSDYEASTEAVAIQSDGKVLVGGGTLIPGESDQALILRFNTDGSLDSSFDSDGRVNLDIADQDNEVKGLVVQEDQKIVALVDYVNADEQCGLIRLNSDGSLDSDFGSAGIVEINFINTNRHSCLDIKQHDNDKLVVLFEDSDADTTYVVQFDVDGSVNNSWGSDGILDLESQFAEFLVITRTSSVMVVGTSDSNKVKVNRYTSIGNTSSSFGTSGSFEYDFGGRINNVALSILDDYQFLIATSTRDDDDLKVIKVSEWAGGLDTSFGTDGIAAHDIDSEIFRLGENNAMLVQADGKIMLVGSTYLQAPITNRFISFTGVRLNSDGSLDYTFTDSGAKSFYFSGEDNGRALDSFNSAIQLNNGSIFVAGVTVEASSDSSNAVIAFSFESEADTDGDGLRDSLDDDDDGDGFSDNEELDNGTSTTDATDQPTDSDSDGISDLYDNDDNNDGVIDGLDASWNVRGLVEHQAVFPFDGDYDAEAFAIAVQDDGKILLAGESDAGGVPGELLIARFHNDASLDESFDDDGIVNFNIAGQSDEINAVMPQSNGKVVALNQWSNSDRQCGLVALNSDGSLDTDFGVDGLAVIDTLNTDRQNCRDAEQDNAGNFLVLATTDDVLLARFDADGKLDTNFNDDGIIETGGSSSERLDIALQSSDKVLLVSDTTISRYDNDGNLDTTFGTDGAYSISLTESIRYNNIKVLPDDNIFVMVGLDDSLDLQIIKVLADGSGLDTNFGDNGIATISANGGSFFMSSFDAFVVQNDGKLMLVVQSYRLNPISESQRTLTAIRLNADGSVDTSFATNGFLDVLLSDASGSSKLGDINDLVQQKDGKILVAGEMSYGWQNVGDTMFAVRFESETNTDGDDLSDSIDPDDDNDGVEDSEDAFPLDSTESIDTDGDGIGNNADTDDDGDGVDDASDAFPLDATETTDSDGDGVGDNSDAFPNDGTETVDTDGDGIGNNADTDDDGDQIPDEIENQNGLDPLDSSDGNLDLDSDGVLNTDEAIDGTDLSDPNDLLNPLATSFDGDGYLTVNYDDSVSTEDYIYGLNTSNNQILATGYIYPYDDNTEPTVMRLNLDGSLDSSFGNDGFFSTIGMEIDSYGRQTYVLKDGSLMVSAEWDASLLKVTENGVLDTSFFADQDYPGIWEVPGAERSIEPVVLELTDGSLIVSSATSSRFYEAQVRKFDANGNSISDFGNSGIFSSGMLRARVEFMHEQSDGSILVGLQNYLDVTIIKISAAGVLDTSFGESGYVTYDSNRTIRLQGMVKLADDRFAILLEGEDVNGKDGLHVIRLHSDGSEDTSFATDGMFTLAEANYENLQGINLFRQDDGTFIIAAYQSIQNGRVALAARLTQDGTLDTSFNSDGIARRLFSRDFNIYAATLSANHDVLFAGYDNSGDSSVFAIASFDNQSDIDGDGVEDFSDAFPEDASESTDNDGDGIGDNADTDDDNDGYSDTDEQDNGTSTTDSDDIPADNDDDFISDLNDSDDDNDGVSDDEDAFPFDNSESSDTDGDGIGNNADTDDDGDGVSDDEDAFPLDENESLDTDGDGIGNNADSDDDGDGVSDDEDAFPLDENESLDTDGDGIGNNADSDDDGDGVSDDEDAFPLDETEWLDSDGDGIGDNSDDTPYPPAGELNLSVSEYSVDENAGTLEVTVNRSGGDYGELQVDYALQDASATANVDYEYQAGTLTFINGEISKTITISIVDDADYEGDEAFTIQLSNLVGDGTIGSLSMAMIVIAEDEAIPPAGEIGFEQVAKSVNENDTNVTLNVIRTGGSFGELGVSYNTTDASAIAGTDYVALSGNLTFADGETSQSISITLVNDDVYESDEQFAVQLSNLTGDGVLDSQAATITIVDDEPTPDSGIFVFENATFYVDENAASIEIDVVRVDGDFGEATVEITSVGQNSAEATATEGEDYERVSQTLSFADGETSKSVTLIINDDANYEGDEYFILDLTNAVGAGIGPQSSTDIFIREDDAVPPAGVFQFSGSNYQVDESSGEVLLTVTRSNGSYGEVRLNLNTVDDTARDGVDYQGEETTLTFLDGETNQTVRLIIHNNDDYQGDRSFTASLSGLVGDGSIGAIATTTINILEDEATPPAGILQFSGESYSANESDGILILTVMRTEGSYGDVSVDYTVTDESAINGTDFVAVDGTLYFSDGEMSQQIEIEIKEDSLDEDLESFLVTLSNPVNTSIGNLDSAQVSISDNDETPTVVDPPETTTGGGGGAFHWWLILFGLFMLWSRSGLQRKLTYQC
ncbi:Calx-beta domain-containing protein [Aliikangiella coralliicola]|uniref:Calx-beta domain-containing protein n=1 Tax=Aliikangiella coralliicola TaxID=2592383 RepID=A0A545UJ81_9GAMM|nr:Calx-beta domain-containing protein [Aliikangiella coralliicola]TQV89522.1 hypothetical protein FLL46_01165 [Aliikangiella coralliicola]